MGEFRVIQWGSNGQYFLDFYYEEEFVRRIRVARSYTKEELQEIINALADNVTQALEHALLYGSVDEREKAVLNKKYTNK